MLRHEFPEPARPGRPDTANAQGVIEVIARAVDLVSAGEAAARSAQVPIHKKALKDGVDFAYPGHTEYLAALGRRRPRGHDAGLRRAARGACHDPYPACRRASGA